MMPLEDFLAVFLGMRDVKEHEFKNAGCQGDAPPNVDVEAHFRESWHAYRSNPHLWLGRAGFTEATQLWGLLTDKVDFEDFKRKRNARLLG